MTTTIYEEINYCDPLSVYSHFAGQSWAFFLDSADHSIQLNTNNRYSYIVIDPFIKIILKNTQLKCNNEYSTCTDPFGFLKQTLSPFQSDTCDDLPPFQGGAVGYFAYELCHYLEKISDKPLDDLEFDDLVIGIYDLVISFDHQQKRAWIVSSGWPEINDASRLKRAKQRLEWLISQINFEMRLPSIKKLSIAKENIISNFSKKDYMQAVSRAINYIKQGDIFEVNLSQRFRTDLPEKMDYFSLYCSLRKINKAPFSAYLSLGNTILASSSPEKFLQLEKGNVEARPIKGTIKRGATVEEDRELALLLQLSEKDRAENIMIVDLLRNDLSKVCEEHSIYVAQLCGLESFATVHHLVSVIEGKLKSNHHPMDLLRATFPGGSITGAPKVRSQEIIAEIEPHHRGPYCGSIGYISFNQSMNTSIVIRTFAIKNQTITFHAGGAIVLDSDPESEYEETLNKASALQQALLQGEQ